MTTTSNKMTEKVNVTDEIVQSFGYGLWAYIAIAYTAIVVQSIGEFYSPVEPVIIEQVIVEQPVIIEQEVDSLPGIPVPFNTTFEQLPENLDFDFHGDFIATLGTLLPEKVRHYGFCNYDLTYCNTCNYEMDSFIKGPWISSYPTEDVPHYIIHSGLEEPFFRRLKDCAKPLPGLLYLLPANIVHEDDIVTVSIAW